MKKRPGPLFFLILFALTLGACIPNISTRSAQDDALVTASEQTLQAQMTKAAQPTPEQQTQPPTQTAASQNLTQAPSLTSTSISPTEPPPPPKSGALSGSTEIVFIPGGTSMFFQDPIRTGEEDVYTIRAAAGQTMIVSAASPNVDVYLEITGIQNGETLLASTAHASDWTGTLPSTQDYKIALTTTNPDTYYFLSVEVPANITFQPGSTSTHIEGVINAYTQFYPNIMTRVSYLVQVPAGKTLNVALSSPNLEALSMGVIGQQDGQPYLRYEVKNSGYYGAVPITQGYYLYVYSVSGESVPFTLDIKIE